MICKFLLVAMIFVCSCSITASAQPQTFNKADFGDQQNNADLSWQLIDQLYAYDGDDLGCTFVYQDDKAIANFKLWAPKAENVEILFYDKLDQTKLLNIQKMQKTEKGVWHCQHFFDLKSQSFPYGYYYQYKVYNPNRKAKLVLDPYAKSMAATTVTPDARSALPTNDFIGKAAVIDPSKTGNSPSPANIKNFNTREDAIIYEIHLRDFTSDPSIDEDLNHPWGTYLAFIDKLDYIKQLGVTHIQFLPLMAWFYGDETKMRERELHYSSQGNNYNWGYDPQNYFSPSGAYSQNPNDPALRIAELKKLFDAIHKAGMGVILDVVYTHMANASFLDDIVPDYYFFMGSDGNFLGDFGNNLATNRAMAKKLMVDSVKYWFQEYKIDGMRWDMMGDATKASVQESFDAAVKINPKTIFLGEGWRTFKGHLEDPTLAGQGADQDWMAETNNVGVFSDEFRNELKSGFGSEGMPMFLTNGPRKIDILFANIKAQPSNTPATTPGDMIQYIEAHDNMPLFDIIAKSIKKDPDIKNNNLEIHKRIRIGNTILLASQGTPFIHAGQEYGRTKQWRAAGVPQQKYHEVLDAKGKPFKFPYFIHDSYDSSDAINMFDWQKATGANNDFKENLITSNFTKGLIAIRRSTDAFSLKSQKEVNDKVKLIPALDPLTEDLAIAWSSTATNGEIFYVFVNADTKKRSFFINFDFAACFILADATRAGITNITDPSNIEHESNIISLDSLSIAILKHL